jgi:hypothetical protein
MPTKYNICIFKQWQSQICAKPEYSWPGFVLTVDHIDTAGSLMWLIFGLQPLWISNLHHIAQDPFPP